MGVGVTTNAQASFPTDFQMPFPCGEVWHASTYSGHGALDFNAYPGDSGRAVIASASGVASTGFDAGWGNYVLINHGSGWQTRYAHLQSVGVSGAVGKGQIVGYVGSTGSATAPHLHWEQILNDVRQTTVYANGSIINPGTSYTSSDPAYTSQNCAAGGSGVGTRLLGDVNGDGRYDAVVMFRDSGTPMVALSSGSSFTAPSAWAYSHTVNADRYFLADVNGDGKDDLVAGWLSIGRWYVSRAGVCQRYTRPWWLE